MSDLTNCPYCGKKLYLNSIGDTVCVNCGIIELSENKESKQPDYVG